MAIPDFQSCMLPLLELCADGKEKSLKELVPVLGKELRLSEEELKTMLPSGAAPLFYNRVAWAKSYINKAGLIEPVRRGVFKISQRGLDVLSEKLARIDIKYLKRFDEYREGKETGAKGNDDSSGENDSIPESGKTPDELISDGYKYLRNELADQILNQVKEGSWQFFEHMVIDLLLAMGYGESKKSSAEALGKTGDEGVDGVINEDKLGLDVIYIQAKKWDEGTPIGRPEIQKFVGALQGKRARKGIFITTSRFTKDAEEYASNIDTRVILIDGKRLSNLMIDHNIGVSIRETYTIKRMDSDYFIEE